MANKERDKAWAAITKSVKKFHKMFQCPVVIMTAMDELFHLCAIPGDMKNMTSYGVEQFHRLYPNLRCDDSQAETAEDRSMEAGEEEQGDIPEVSTKEEPCEVCLSGGDDLCPLHAKVSHYLDREVDMSHFGAVDFAVHTLPDALSLKSSLEGRAEDFRVFAAVDLPSTAVFGPLVGTMFSDKTQVNMMAPGTWAIVEDEGTTGYIQASDPATSNWMMYVRCAASEDEQNVAPVTCRGEIYYKALRRIEAEEELLLWYGKEQKKTGLGTAFYTAGERAGVQCAECHRAFISTEKLDRHRLYAHHVPLPIPTVARMLTDTKIRKKKVVRGRGRPRKRPLSIVGSWSENEVKTEQPVVEQSSALLKRVKRSDSDVQREEVGQLAGEGNMAVIEAGEAIIRVLEAETDQQQDLKSGELITAAEIEPTNLPEVNAEQNTLAEQIMDEGTGQILDEGTGQIMDEGMKQIIDEGIEEALDGHTRQIMYDGTEQTMDEGTGQTVDEGMKQIVDGNMGAFGESMEDSLPKEQVFDASFVKDDEWEESQVPAGHSGTRLRITMSEESFRRAREFKCHVCLQVFEDSDELEEHEASHADIVPYRCIMCETTFMNPFKLGKHVIERHTNPENGMACRICGMELQDKRTRNLHEKERHLRPDGMFQCYHCDKLFPRPTHVLRHSRHHTGDKPFACQYCPLRYTELSTLMKHVRKHTNERPYQCQYCSKKFHVLQNLKHHERIHEGNKPFACDVCGQSFTQWHHRERHLRTHQGSKPYACSVCSKSYSDKHSLLKHERTHEDVMEAEVMQIHKCTVERLTNGSAIMLPVNEIECFDPEEGPVEDTLDEQHEGVKYRYTVLNPETGKVETEYFLQPV